MKALYVHYAIAGSVEDLPAKMFLTGTDSLMFIITGAPNIYATFNIMYGRGHNN